MSAEIVRSATGSLVRRTGASLGIIPVLIVLLVIMSFLEPTFRSYSNLLNIVRTSSVLFVLAMAMTFVVLTAGIDLSVGSMLALSGLILFFLLQAGLSSGAAVILVVLISAAIGGIVNGFLIGKVGLSFFVVTLASLAIFRGTAYVLTNGLTKPIADWPLIQRIGDGNAGPVPVPAIIMVIVFAVSWYVLRFTYFGRNVYAVGGNIEAARLSGIRTHWVTTAVYAITGGAAGLAGVMQAGRLLSVSPVVGAGVELDVAAAVLLGGTSLAGGIGSVTGTAFGVLFIAALRNGLTIVGVASFWQLIVTGLILIAAVGYDQARRGILTTRHRIDTDLVAPESEAAKP